MKKGIVMESSNKWTVVLTSDGKFEKIPFQPDHREGSEISFSKQSIVDSERTRSRLRTLPLFRGGAIVAACMLIFLTVLPFFGGTDSYAAVMIEINPSVELSVDREGKVIRVDSFTEAGANLLRAVPWKNETLPIVTLNIINQAELMGFLTEQRRVLITTTYLDEDRSENIGQLLEENISIDEELTVVLIEGDLKYRQEAREKQISLGLLMLERMMAQEGFQLTDNNAGEWDVKALPAAQGIDVIQFRGDRDINDKSEKAIDNNEFQDALIGQEVNKQPEHQQAETNSQPDRDATSIRKDVSVEAEQRQDSTKAIDKEFNSSVRQKESDRQYYEKSKEGAPRDDKHRNHPSHLKESDRSIYGKGKEDSLRDNKHRNHPGHLKESDRRSYGKSKEESSRHDKKPHNLDRSKERGHERDKHIRTHHNEKEKRDRRPNDRGKTNDEVTP